MKKNIGKFMLSVIFLLSVACVLFACKANNTPTIPLSPPASEDSSDIQKEEDSSSDAESDENSSDNGGIELPDLPY